jgi:hypothetical protein
MQVQMVGVEIQVVGVLLEMLKVKLYLSRLLLSQVQATRFRAATSYKN